jgi:hypothetical protein
MELTRLNLAERILALVGVLAFIDSFLPWFSVRVNVPFAGIDTGLSTNGWTTGIGGWLPVVLLVTLGVLAVRPAFGNKQVKAGRGYLLYATLAALAVVIIVIRWATYPSVDPAYAGDISQGAALGTIVGLLLALGAAVTAWFVGVKRGGSLGAGPSGTAASDRPEQPGAGMSS